MPAAGDVIVFPDAVDLACAEVKALLGSALDVPLTGRVDSPRPSRFVRLRLVGGFRETLISRQVTLTVEGYAGTETEATRLCSLVSAALVALDGVLFGGFESAGPAELPDPTTSQQRATATVGIRVRGSKLA